MKKIFCLILVLAIVFGCMGLVQAGSQGSGMNWGGTPEYTQAYAYMSDTGYLNVSVYLYHENSLVAQANELDVGYVYVETAWKMYDHSECSYDATFYSYD
ncbi:MAG: hypothetical protein JXN10_05145 [Clostridia bacterium]|nr:hypothetical protein [Clostridia bacterium]MBN2882892.1 hypothetical protein [Clostridia bacterium]